MEMTPTRLNVPLEGLSCASAAGLSVPSRHRGGYIPPRLMVRPGADRPLAPGCGHKVAWSRAGQESRGLPRRNAKITKQTGLSFAVCAFSCGKTPSRRCQLGLGGCGEEDHIASNHLVEANRRPAAPPDAGSQFVARFSARPGFPAAVADLLRWVDWVGFVS